MVQGKWPWETGFWRSNFINSCHLVLCMTTQNLIKIVGFVSTQVHNVYLHLSPCNKSNSKLSFFRRQPLLVPAWYIPLQPCINLNASSLGCHGEIPVPSTLMVLEAEIIIAVLMYTIKQALDLGWIPQKIYLYKWNATLAYKKILLYTFMHHSWFQDISGLTN